MPRLIPTPFPIPTPVATLSFILPEPFSKLPPAFWHSLFTAIAIFLFQKLWNVIVDRERQTINGTIIRSVGDFQEKFTDRLNMFKTQMHSDFRKFADDQAGLLRRYAEKSSDDFTNQMVSISGLEHTMKQTMEKITEFNKSIESIVEDLESHEKRISKIEFRKDHNL